MEDVIKGRTLIKENVAFSIKENVPFSIMGNNGSSPTMKKLICWDMIPVEELHPFQRGPYKSLLQSLQEFLNLGRVE